MNIAGLELTERQARQIFIAMQRKRHIENLEVAVPNWDGLSKRMQDDILNEYENELDNNDSWSSCAQSAYEYVLSINPKPFIPTTQYSDAGRNE